MLQQLLPTTRDQNELYVDPSNGPYLPAMPGSPERQPKFRNVSFSAGLDRGVRQPQLLPSSLNDELSDLYRNDPAWMLQIRR
jgi:hypothetical protein